MVRPARPATRRSPRTASWSSPTWRKVYDVDHAMVERTAELADDAAATARAASTARTRGARLVRPRRRRRRPTPTSSGRSPRRSAPRASTPELARRRSARRRDRAIRTCSRSPPTPALHRRRRRRRDRAMVEAARRACRQGRQLPRRQGVDHDVGRRVARRSRRPRSRRSRSSRRRRTASTRRSSATRVDWLNGKRGGYGEWGNTQATILGAQGAHRVRRARAPDAVGRHGDAARQRQATAGTIHFEKGRKDALVVGRPRARRWRPATTRSSSGSTARRALPYTIAVDVPLGAARSRRTAPKVAVTTAARQDAGEDGRGREAARARREHDRPAACR